MKTYKPRFTICTITTSDEEMLHKVDTVKHMGIGHTEIYEAGLKYYLDGNKPIDIIK